MPVKKLSREEFVERSVKVHGLKYDYSKVNYVNTKTRVTIICPIHGPFDITPEKHILRRQGCPVCGDEANKSKIFGAGINDLRLGTADPCYVVWYNILERTLNEKVKERHPTYKNCSICEEWLYLSNFKKWYDKNHIEGFHIDKDILSNKDRKIYSPETCCFVPREINGLFVSAKAARGDLPIGVTFHNNKFEARLSTPRKRITIGRYSTKEEAFLAYKSAKEAYIKEVAQEYFDKGLINKRVYDALIRYEVKITD